MGRLYDAFVEVGPRFTGFGDIKSQGDKAGKAYGKALADAAVKAAKADARKLGEALAKARSAEADAAGKVRVAEAKLNDTRANSKATTSQLAAAEESLARAQRKSAAAADTSKEATEALSRAQKKVTTTCPSGYQASGGAISSVGFGAHLLFFRPNVTSSPVSFDFAASAPPGFGVWNLAGIVHCTR